MLSPSRTFLATLLVFTIIVASYPAVATVWIRLSPANSPHARYYPAMAYDPVSRKVVLFGGSNGRQQLLNSVHDREDLAPEEPPSDP